jgi:spore coat protein CotH
MRRCRLCALAILVAAMAIVAAAPRALSAQTTSDQPDAFFDDTLVHDINLVINSRDWESLKVNFLDNSYYPCDFRWRDKVVRNIGIRSRGTGSRSGVKPGLRLDFNRYTSGQQFLGLKSVILRNNTQDPSNMRERLSMLFFRRMGVTAEREAHARLFINNAFVGVYTIVESYDETFLKKNFGEDAGNLYEYKFDNAAPIPYNFGYPGNDPSLYTPLPFKPETNVNDPRGDILERFFWTVNVASDAVWRSAMAEFLDLSKFIRHLAIENYLAEEDGLTGDYGPNNFYFYRFANQNLYTFLPWDKSNTFWEAPSPDYSIFRNIDNAIENRRNRLVVRALQDPELRELYLNTLLACADSAAAVQVSAARVRAADTPAAGWMETEISREYDQIKVAVASDPTTITSTQDFEQAVADMKTFARGRGDAIRQQVAADRARRGLLK